MTCAPERICSAGADGGASVPVDGVYFGACLTTLAAGRIDRVLRFYSEVKYTPDTGGNATVELKLTALKLGPNNTAPPTVSKSETVGNTYTTTRSAAPRGIYQAPLGNVTVPGAANPISGRDILIEQAAAPGHFAVGKFCSQLSGHVTQPIDIELVGNTNACIYLPVNEGDPTPVLQASDFPDTCALD